MDRLIAIVSAFALCSHCLTSAGADGTGTFPVQTNNSIPLTFSGNALQRDFDAVFMQSRRHFSSSHDAYIFWPDPFWHSNVNTALIWSPGSLAIHTIEVFFMIRTMLILFLFLYLSNLPDAGAQLSPARGSWRHTTRLHGDTLHDYMATHYTTTWWYATRLHVYTTSSNKGETTTT